MLRYFLITGVIVSCTSAGHDDKVSIPSPESLQQLAIEESVMPVHPGIPGERPFWNGYAQRFIYAPAFDFKEMEGAENYRFTAAVEDPPFSVSFIAKEPWEALTPIWKELPVDMVNLTVEAIKDDKAVGMAGERSFYKASPYHGPYHERKITYRASVEKSLRYLFEAPYIKHWIDHEVPDPEYGLYGYPSKMFSAVIHGMLMFREFTEDPREQEEALQIAQIVADHLIGISEPKGEPLEYFPPTYTGPIYADILKEYREEDLSDRIMLIYPAVAGQAFLSLFDVTNDPKYFDAALRIARTYQKLQLENGTWRLLLYIENGEPVADNFVVPTGVHGFLDRLSRDYEIRKFEDVASRAIQWVEKSLVEDFNWEGQFEDQKPSEQYRNLSKGQACNYALNLLNGKKSDSGDIARAEEIIRFAEDQFVIWENPAPVDAWGIKSDTWLLPCVLEQYNFYTPVNASSANMIEVYWNAHRKTGKILYLAKAMELANSLVYYQKDSGHYPTYLVSDLLDQEGWINCMVFAAKAVNDLDEYLMEIGGVEGVGLEIDLLMKLSSIN